MASKSKRSKLSLPDPRELILQQKEQKGIGKAVEGAIHTLKDRNLFRLSERAQQNYTTSYLQDYKYFLEVVSIFQFCEHLVWKL